jgi:endo-1,3-1,4-beta-glycanase ExoK
MIDRSKSSRCARGAASLAALLLAAGAGCGGSDPVQPSTTPTPVPRVGGAAESQPFFSAFQGPVDTTAWSIADGNSFTGNGCWAFPAATVAGPDFLSLWIQRLGQPVQGKAYGCGGLSTRRQFSYGTFTVRLRGPIVSGSTCSFFLMNTWQAGRWLHKEIDIEFLGKSPHLVQFTVHRVYSDSEQQTSPSSCVTTLPFDYKADFHEYAIAWAPQRIAWRVDGQEVCQETQRIPDEPLTVLMNHWPYDPNDSATASGMAAWLGPLNDADLPSRADYAWVRYTPLE